MNDYFDLIQSTLKEYAYFAIFLALLLENTAMIGVIIPGVSVLLIAGFISAVGDLNPFYCLAAGFAGTVAGDNISYLLGRYGSEKLRFVRRLTRRNRGLMARVQSLNLRVLIFFHFAGYLRMGLPLIFGVAGYNFRRWIVIDIIGSLGFNTAFVALGFFIARTTGYFTDASNIGMWLQIGFTFIFAVWLIAFFHGILRFRRYSKS